MHTHCLLGNIVPLVFLNGRKSGPHSCICAPIEYWECGPLSTPPPAKGEGPSVLSRHSGRPHPLRTTALTGTHLTTGTCLGRKYTCLSHRITGRFIGWFCARAVLGSGEYSYERLKKKKKDKVPAFTEFVFLMGRQKKQITES